METFLIKAVQLILALSLLVVVHEFGHYFFARLFGIRVEKFYLFFNPWFTPFKWKPKPPKVRKYKKDGRPKASWRDTEYGIGWIPLGGYCKIAGMIDESMDKEQMAQPAQPDEFRSRPAWQRLLVMIGGVLFNFIFAIIIYVGIALHWGKDYIPFENAVAGMNFSEKAQEYGYRNGDIILLADGETIDATGSPEYDIANAKEVTVLRDGKQLVIKNPKDFPMLLDGKKGLFDNDISVNLYNPYRVPVYIKNVVGNTAASRAGFEEGDHLVSINGIDVPSYTEFVPLMQEYSGTEVRVGVIRADAAPNDTTYLTVVPEDGKIGFVLQEPTKLFDIKTERFNIFTAVPVGISDGCKKLSSYVSSLKFLFTKNGAKNLGGFGAIIDFFPEKWDWRKFWEMTAFLSVILAFMNILPIPALDGGHVMFVLYEMITRRKPSDKFLERAQMAGMIFLLALLLFANGNDIYKAIFK